MPWVMMVLLVVETPGALLTITLVLRLLLLLESLHGAAVMLVVVDGRRHMQTSSLSFVI
jgi:hypothetical protein